MNQLHKALGRIPYRYAVQSDFNDYQVTVAGPAGRAVITAVNDGEDYEIETVFDSQGVRMYHGFESPAAALCRIVALTDTCLRNRGETPPPVVDPRRIVAVLVLVVLALLALSAVALVAITSTGDDDGHRPTAPITYTPARNLEAPR